MIPAFPEFKNISVDDREVVESHTHRYPPYSDFNFTSLWAWDTSNERMISELNGNLVVRFTDYATNEPFLSFLGANKQNETALTLLEYCAANGLPSHLKLVPEISVKEIDPQRFHIEEDRDNFDYIYDIAKISIYAGKELERKRTNIHKFKREHSEALFEIIDLAKKNTQDSILNMFSMWEKKKVKEEKSVDIAHEFSSINRLCETIDVHKLLVTAIFIKEMMIAFSIDEVLPDDYAICHFWRADTTYGATYDLLMQEKAKYLRTLGVSLMNYEQDLGIPALRFSKNSFRPIKMLKKYVMSKTNVK